METRTKEQAISELEKSLSSIYTKEDVIKLISSINVGGGNRNEELTEQIKFLKKLLKEIKNEVSSFDSYEICNQDSIELSLNGFELNIDNINCDFDPICEKIDEIFEEEISKFEEELEELEKEEE